MTTNVFGEDASTQAYAISNFVSAVVCSVFSLITIVILHRMKASNGHLLLLLWMSYFQFIYDLFSFTSNINCGYYITVFSLCFHIPMGMAQGFMNIWMSAVAVYIVYLRRQFDVRKNLPLILSTCLGLGIVDGILYFIATVPEENRNEALVTVAVIDISNNVRIGTIFANAFVVMLIFAKVTYMSAGKKQKSEVDRAALTLACRMMLYPVCQVIGRVGYSWYEFSYGSSRNLNDLTVEKLACLLFLSIMAPAISIGYLMSLIIMQPLAYDHLIAIIYCQSYENIGNSQQGLASDHLGTLISWVVNLRGSTTANVNDNTAADAAAIGDLPTQAAVLAGVLSAEEEAAAGKKKTKKTKQHSMVFDEDDEFGGEERFSLYRDSIADSRTDEELHDILARHSQHTAENRNSVFSNRVSSFSFLSRPSVIRTRTISSYQDQNQHHHHHQQQQNPLHVTTTATPQSITISIDEEQPQTIMSEEGTIELIIVNTNTNENKRRSVL